MGQRTNLLLQVERFGKPSEEGIYSLFRGEERSAKGHGRSGARHCRKYRIKLFRNTIRQLLGMLHEYRCLAFLKPLIKIRLQFRQRAPRLPPTPVPTWEKIILFRVYLLLNLIKHLPQLRTQIVGISIPSHRFIPSL